MDYATLITPEMLELILPLLGFSILMNFVLLAALIFRSLQNALMNRLQLFWIGILLAVGAKKPTSK